MLSNGISAPSGLQPSQDSMSYSASRRVAASTSTTWCCLGVGSKKSRDTVHSFIIVGIFDGCARNCAHCFRNSGILSVFRFLDLRDFLRHVEHFQPLHGVRLVLFLRTSIPHHHIEL